MTCRADKCPEDDFKGNRFKNVCYKCGRPMWFVKGSNKIQGEWVEGWLVDEEIFTSQGLSMVFDSGQTIKISEEDDKFIHDEYKKWEEKQKKLWEPYMKEIKKREEELKRGECK